MYKRQVCERARHPLILLGGPEDAADGDRLAAIDPIKIYNACGKFNINESAGLVRQAKLIVTHDTGLMHIAACLLYTSDQRPLPALPSCDNDGCH